MASIDEQLESISKSVQKLVADIQAEQRKIEPTHFLNGLTGRIGSVLFALETMAKSIAVEADKSRREAKDLRDRLAYELEQAKQAREEASRLPDEYKRHIDDIAKHARALTEAVYQSPYEPISEVIGEYENTYY